MKSTDRITRLFQKKSSLTAREIMAETGWGRAWVTRLLNRMIAVGQVSREGDGAAVFYKWCGGVKEKGVILPNENLSEDRVFSQNFADWKSKIPAKIWTVFQHAFVEMFNNAIEHSRSAEISIRSELGSDFVAFEIRDWGVGVFADFQKQKNLENELQAVQEIFKGKQTTDPERHSGEGIFFTSKMCSRFLLQSGVWSVSVFNKTDVMDDFSLSKIDDFAGTLVACRVDFDLRWGIADIFEKYADADTAGFVRTHTVVKLFEMDDSWMSRSQARRMLVGLEKFTKITLDFRGVAAVGQGFCDEVFRVWARAHPAIDLEVINAESDILFMIDRSKK